MTEKIRFLKLKNEEMHLPNSLEHPRIIQISNSQFSREFHIYTNIQIILCRKWVSQEPKSGANSIICRAPTISSSLLYMAWSWTTQIFRYSIRRLRRLLYFKQYNLTVTARARVPSDDNDSYDAFHRDASSVRATLAGDHDDVVGEYSEQYSVSDCGDRIGDDCGTQEEAAADASDAATSAFGDQQHSQPPSVAAAGHGGCG